MAKYLVALRFLGCGICAMEDSLGEGRGYAVNASQAFEQLIPMMKFHISKTKALRLTIIH